MHRRTTISTLRFRPSLTVPFLSQRRCFSFGRVFLVKYFSNHSRLCLNPASGSIVPLLLVNSSLLSPHSLQRGLQSAQQCRFFSTSIVKQCSAVRRSSTHSKLRRSASEENQMSAYLSMQTIDLSDLVNTILPSVANVYVLYKRFTGNVALAGSSVSETENFLQLKHSGLQSAWAKGGGSVDYILPTVLVVLTNLTKSDVVPLQRACSSLLRGRRGYERWHACILDCEQSARAEELGFKVNSAKETNLEGELKDGKNAPSSTKKVFSLSTDAFGSHVIDGVADEAHSLISSANIEKKKPKDENIEKQNLSGLRVNYNSIENARIKLSLDPPEVPIQSTIKTFTGQASPSISNPYARSIQYVKLNDTHSEKKKTPISPRGLHLGRDAMPSAFNQAPIEQERKTTFDSGKVANMEPTATDNSIHSPSMEEGTPSHAMPYSDSLEGVRGAKDALPTKPFNLMRPKSPQGKYRITNHQWGHSSSTDSASNTTPKKSFFYTPHYLSLQSGEPYKAPAEPPTFSHMQNHQEAPVKQSTPFFQPPKVSNSSIPPLTFSRSARLRKRLADANAQVTPSKKEPIKNPRLEGKPPIYTNDPPTVYVDAKKSTIKNPSMKMGMFSPSVNPEKRPSKALSPPAFQNHPFVASEENAASMFAPNSAKNNMQTSPNVPVRGLNASVKSSLAAPPLDSVAEEWVKRIAESPRGRGVPKKLNGIPEHVISVLTHNIQVFPAVPTKPLSLLLSTHFVLSSSNEKAGKTKNTVADIVYVDRSSTKNAVYDYKTTLAGIIFAILNYRRQAKITSEELLPVVAVIRPPRQSKLLFVKTEASLVEDLLRQRSGFEESFVCVLEGDQASAIHRIFNERM